MKIGLFFTNAKEFHISYSDKEAFESDISELEKVRFAPNEWFVLDNQNTEISFKGSELLAYTVKR